MKKLVILILILSLFAIETKAWEKTSLGPDLIIESLTLNPYPVKQGETFELTIKVRNSDISKTIKAPKIWIEESYPFTSLSQPKVQILNSLAPNEETLLTFKIKVNQNAINGVNELRIRFQEKVGAGSDPIHSSEPIKVDVKASGIELSVASVETIPKEIYPGDEAQIKLTLKNNLPILMKNLDISFNFDAGDIPFTPLGTTAQRTLTSLNKGSEKEFFFDIAVEADAEPKVYKVNLKIDYEDEFGNSYNVNTTTGIKISTSPELQVSVEKSEVLQSQTSGKVTIKLANTGLADIKFLTAKLQTSNDYKILSSQQEYVGNIESDDYETADFTIFAKTNRKQLPLKLLLKYKDSFNKEYIIEETIYVPNYAEFKLSSLGLNSLLKYIIYIIIIVFIYISFKEWRKTKNLSLAFRVASKTVLIRLKRIIKLIRPRTLFRVIRATLRFFKEP